MKKVVISLVALPIALTLTGCGDKTNAQFNQNNNFWKEDVNYSETKVFGINPVGTIFDNELKDAFRQLGLSHSLEGVPPKTQEGLERAIAQIEVARNAIDKLPMPDELKAKYEADLARVESVMPEAVAFYESKYNGELEKIYRERHPAEFAVVDTAKSKLTEREAYLAEAKQHSKTADAVNKAAGEALNDLQKSSQEKVQKWIVDNDLLISANNLRFTLYVSNNTRDKAECEKYGVDMQKTPNYYWNSDSSVCFAYSIRNDNLGLSRYDINKMNTEQKAEFIVMATEYYNAGLKLGFKKSTTEKQREDAILANRNRTLLADNRFGSTRTIHTEINNANRALNRATNGGYTQDGRLPEPRKGQYNREHRRVFTEVAKEKGFNELPYMTAFTPENAHVVYNALLDKTYSEAIDFEVDKKGRFKIDEENRPERMIVALKTNSGKRMIANVSARKNDKGKYIANHQNLVNGELLSDLENPTSNGYQMYFSLKGDNEHRDYRSFLQANES